MSERTTPWYGSYPPKLKGGNREMVQKSWWKQPTFWILVGIAIFGIVIILITNFYIAEDRIGNWFTVINHIGIAFLVAGILGITIELFLSQRLAEDAFKATIGYLLPDELKPEMEWVYQQKTIANSSSLMIFSIDLSLYLVG